MKNLFFFLFFFFPFHDEAVSWIVKFVKQYDYPFPVWVLSRFQPKWSIVWFFFPPHIQLYIIHFVVCVFLFHYMGVIWALGRWGGVWSYVWQLKEIFWIQIEWQRRWVGEINGIRNETRFLGNFNSPPEFITYPNPPFETNK